MRLDQELVARKLCESRTEAQECISGGFVLVDGVVSLKQARQVSGDARIEVIKRRNFVSRGGEKLSGVLHHIYGNDDSIGQFCHNATVLDVGSSTGGFTDCLLSFGVQKVDAVDIGTSQLHSKIKEDNKVTSYENTDIRTFTSPYPYTIIVADLSFIPLTRVLEKIISFGTIGTTFFLLIKPQFEVGKGNTTKGIVKNLSKIIEVLDFYKNEAERVGLRKAKIIPSEIKGGGGNQEYFLHGTL